MTAETIRDQAEALRAGLIGGFASIRDVVIWADGLVGEDRGDDAPQLFDLALLRPGDVGRAVSLLGEVPGELHPGEVGREIAALLHRRFATGELTERQAARALFAATLEGLAPDEEFAGMAYYFDDGVDLAVRGVYGSLPSLRAELLDYLARFNRQPVA
jgi:hypothetical protein